MQQPHTTRDSTLANTEDRASHTGVVTENNNMGLQTVCGVLLLVVVLSAVCSCQDPDEPCVKNAYPPDPKSVSRVILATRKLRFTF